MNLKNGSNSEWSRARNELISAVTSLGFPKELGEEIAVNLGGTKAMTRMTAYIGYVKPRSAEILVDEMLAIKSDIDNWRKKKESLEANAVYNEMLEHGFDDNDN